MPSVTSSPVSAFTRVIFWPSITPPAALSSSMAISAPRSVDRPVSELSEPINPTLTSAIAADAHRAAQAVAEIIVKFFILLLSSNLTNIVIAKPVCPSSTIKTMPCSSQSRRVHGIRTASQSIFALYGSLFLVKGGNSQIVPASR